MLNACSSSPKPKATPLPSKHVRALIAFLISRYLIVPTLSHVSLSILPLGTSQSQELIQFMIPEDEIANYEDFRDCVSELLISRLSGTAEKKKKKASKGRKNEIKPVSKPEQGQEDNDALAADLGETIEVCRDFLAIGCSCALMLIQHLKYLASEIFPSLPDDLRVLQYSDIQNNVQLAEKYSTPLDSDIYEDLLQPMPLSVSDSLTSYGLLSDPTDLPRLLDPLFTAYITSRTTAPPEFAPATRASECEICEREHLPLTYHHLIPRAVHAKVVKRGWHAGWELNKVAWLCRACHSFVHRLATNEELAKEWYSIDLLLERDDVQKWASWVSKVRWKAK
jgi:hypothetical protein